MKLADSPFLKHRLLFVKAALAGIIDPQQFDVMRTTQKVRRLLTFFVVEVQQPHVNEIVSAETVAVADSLGDHPVLVKDESHAEPQGRREKKRMHCATSHDSRAFRLVFLGVAAACVRDRFEKRARTPSLPEQTQLDLDAKNEGEPGRLHTLQSVCNASLRRNTLAAMGIRRELAIK
jgi:hypothetical protein